MIGVGAAITGLGVILAVAEHSSGSDAGVASPGPATTSVSTAGPTTTSQAVPVATTGPTISVPRSTATPTSNASTSTTTATTVVTTMSDAAPVPTATPDEAVTGFIGSLATAIRQRDVAFLTGHLHPFVMDRYDGGSCEAYFSGLDAPSFAIEVVSIGEVGLWEWTTDGLTRAVADATTVLTRTTSNGTTFTDGEAHVQIDSAGFVRWFTDCGTPKEGAS